MVVAPTQFTPWASLSGGVLIGVSALILMAFNGRIAGVSGIVQRLFPPTHRDSVLGSLLFIGGLASAPFVCRAITGVDIVPTFVATTPLMCIAGLAVGFGAVLGNGCTSGHGVCGIARLSKRSIAATLIFMAVGFLTVFVHRHLMGG